MKAIEEVCARGSVLNKALALICTISLALSMAVPNATALAADQASDNDTAAVVTEATEAAGQGAADATQDAQVSEVAQGGETESDEASTQAAAEASVRTGDEVTAEEIAASEALAATNEAAEAANNSTAAQSDATAWDGTTIDTSWYNTTDTSFTISTAAQLAGLAAITSPANDYDAWNAGTHNSRATGIAQDNFKGKTVTLAADINLNDKRFDPISDFNNWGGGGQGNHNGTYDGVCWQGTFDGAGHTVSGLNVDGKVNCSTNYGGYQGLISALGIGGVVKNVGVTGDIYGRVAGAIVGCTNTAAEDTLTTSFTDWPTIMNCWSNVTITANGSGSRGAGGIFGGESDNRCMVNIYNCYSRGSVKNGGTAGGVAGFVNGLVSNCYTTGLVTGSYHGSIVATLFVPAASGAAYKAIGAYGNNYPLTGTDENAYRYSETQSADNPIAVTEGFVNAATLKASAATLGLAYMADTANTNGGYPILSYQAEGGSTPTQISIDGATLSKPAKQAYTGNPVTPKVTVTLNGKELTQNLDYYVAYANNTESGEDTATATVYGVGNYTGSTSVTFTIEKLDWSNFTIDPISPQWSYGASEPATPTLTVKDADGNALTQGTDYDVVYANNVETGTATAGIAAVGSTDVQKSVEFSVVKASESIKGTGTAEDPYQISSKGDYQFVSHKITLGDASYMAGEFVITADITLGSTGAADPCVDPWGNNFNTGTKNENNQFVYNRNYFAGNVDGQGHTVTLNYDTASAHSGYDYYGSFINYLGYYNEKSPYS